MATIASDKYDKLRLLLQQDGFPQNYLHKFVLERTSEAAAELARFEKQFARAVKVGERQSSAPEGKEPRFVAYTYTFPADNAEQIIDLMEWTSRMRGLKTVL